MAIKKVTNTLIKKAEENTSTTVKKGKQETQVKKGIPLDHAKKHETKNSDKVVGLSKGITKNMGDYESFRVDCWLSDVVHPDETSEEALDRLSEIIDRQIQKEVEAIV